MKTHKFVNDPKELLQKGFKIVSQNADNKFVHRVCMVNLMLSGFPAKTLSDYCGDSERTLQSWLKNVDEKGWDSLKSIKQTGRPRRLSQHQIREIKEVVKDKPEKSGYNVWDGPTLSEYIRKTYDIDYGARACQNLMHEMGFALVRSQVYPSLENPDEEAREDLKKIAEAVEDPSLIPVFQDEVHFQAQTTVTRAWVLKGSAPKVMSKPGKNSIAYSGVVIPETGELIVTKPGWFTFESVIQSFRDFLATRPCPEGKKYCMILDNAPWHKKAIRLVWTEERDEYADIRESLAYISLPPYSPDLNPIEQVWRKTRREKTHNKYFCSLSKLISVLDEYFASFAKLDEALRKLCSFKCFA